MFGPQDHSCPMGHLPRVEVLRAATPKKPGSTRSGLGPSTAAVPSLAPAHLGTCFQPKPTLTQQAPNPCSHLERQMFFSLASDSSAPLPAPQRGPQASASSCCLCNLIISPGSWKGEAVISADSHAQQPATHPTLPCQAPCLP